MRKPPQTRDSSTRGRLSAPKRLFLFLLLGVFTFQLARAFIVLEVCAHHRSTGYTMQHCKDGAEGVVPTPVLAEGPAPVAWLPTPEPQWKNSLDRLDQREDAPLFPFFHPPRTSA